MIPLSVRVFKRAIWFNRRPLFTKNRFRNGAAASVAIDIHGPRTRQDWPAVSTANAIQQGRRSSFGSSAVRGYSTTLGQGHSPPQHASIVPQQPHQHQHQHEHRHQHHNRHHQHHQHQQQTRRHQNDGSISPIHPSRTLSATSGVVEDDDCHRQLQARQPRPVAIPFCSMCLDCNVTYGKMMVDYLLKNIQFNILPGFVPKLHALDPVNGGRGKLYLPSSPPSSPSSSSSLSVSSSSTDSSPNSVDSGRASEEESTLPKDSPPPAKTRFSTQKWIKDSLKIEQKLKSGALKKKIDRAKSTDQVPNTRKKIRSSSSTSTDAFEQDLKAVFSQAAANYANRLNNIVAMDLMQSHRPDEAMKCWLNSEASSKAFFNMGVAFESGRYALNAGPDMNRAHDCYAIAASMGHGQAMYNLALFYLYGKGEVVKDQSFGMNLLQAAARKGVSQAKHFFLSYFDKKL